MPRFESLDAIGVARNSLIRLQFLQLRHRMARPPSFLRKTESSLSNDWLFQRAQAMRFRMVGIIRLQASTAPGDHAWVNVRRDS